jgi:hypothetical protein
MARLFITPRELNFISDITKEIIKDVVGQKIHYYPISELKTNSNNVYGEAVRKVFDNPIDLDAIVDSNFQNDTKIDQFGIDAQYRLEVFIHLRDVLEKGLTPGIGDYFSFSSIFYEITDLVYTKNIYGLPEHISGIKLTGLRSRDSQFKTNLMGPTLYGDSHPDAVQTVFVQQRGRPENEQGPTGDVRDLVRNGVIDESLSVARVDKSDSPAGNSFYDEA